MLTLEVEKAAEEDLVDRLRAGDATALEILMERYASRMYRLAHGITGNAEDAEEVVQDVFLTIFRKIHTFEGRSALGSWIYRIATNAALIKRRGRREDREVPLDLPFPTFLPDGHRAGDPAFLKADWSQTPEADLLSKETREILHRAIGNLPDQYRVVVELRDVQGLSNEEVAEVVGESVACVKSRLHRARMVLREHLALGLQSKPGAASSELDERRIAASR
ncbi:MAG TPA: sigma-70 family RNA polymerase sigma factor [Candidatus Methylomirabilis sp.]|nr:sigma-70 family RNA polymerase sigma factor [Candidatus Methylomirabilis sp.]